MFVDFYSIVYSYSQKFEGVGSLVWMDGWNCGDVPWNIWTETFCCHESGYQHILESVITQF